jgi:DeoR/GlpR family transcriptional regulator of sugar metabolism
MEVLVIQVERLNEVSAIVQKEGKITIDEICNRFNISEMTARRDLQELARAGIVRRVHGGAVSAFGRSFEPPYQSRSQSKIQLKRAVGQKAAGLVADGDSIALDVGTTTLEIARALKDRHNLTIVTASLPIAYELVSDQSIGTDIRLILTGGIVRPGELSMIGHIAEQTYNEIHVDKAFIGIGGLSLQDGLTEYNLEDSLVKRSLIRTARQIIVVADASKFGRTTFASVCPLSAVDTIVTDSSVSKGVVQALRQEGIQVLIAD